MTTWRRRLARPTPFALIIGFIVLYIDDLRPYVESNGLWAAAPLLIVLIVGLLTLSFWIEDRIRGLERANKELHNSFVPRQTIEVPDWDAALTANEETINEAIETAKRSSVSQFGCINTECDELIASWDTKGWKVKTFRRSESAWITHVPIESSWAGKELQTTLMGDLLGKRPKDRLSDKQTKAVTMAFFGLADAPQGLSHAMFRRVQSDTSLIH